MITRALFILILFSYALNGHAACSNNIPSNMSSSTPMCGTTKTLSAGVNPSSSLNIQVPNVTTPSIYTWGNTNDFSGLANCPPAPNCPDINGNPSGLADTPVCPNICKVTRSPADDSTIINNPATTVIAPACPPAYSQIYGYNALQEFKPTDVSSLSITSWALFQQLNHPPFSWSDTTSGEWTSSCLGKEKSFADDGQTLYQEGSTSNFFLVNSITGNKLVHLQSIWVQCYALNCPKTTGGFNAYTWNFSSNSSSNSNPGQGTATAGSDGVARSCGAGVNKKFTYRYKHIKFSGIGQYGTGNQIPGTIICSRNIASWATKK